MRSRVVVSTLLVGLLLALALFGLFIVRPSWLTELPFFRRTGPTVESRRKEAEAREKLAFQSLEDRIPRGKGIPLAAPSPATSKRLDLAESDVDLFHGRQARVLRALHEKTQDFFVESS